MATPTKLSAFPTLSGQDLTTNSSTQTMPIGVYMETADGRGFRYAKNGAVATVAGKVYQGPALDASNYQPSGGLTPSSASIGDTSITVTNSLTVAANALAGGYMSVVVTPGQGYTYRVASNTAVSGATNMVVTLEDPLEVAITGSSRVIFAPHPYNGTVIEPGTPTGLIAGVPNRIFTASYYYWIQTKGTCAVLFTGTGVASKAVGSLVGGTSGSMAPAIAATNIGGYHLATGITGEYSLIYLNIG